MRDTRIYASQREKEIEKKKKKKDRHFWSEETIC